MGERRVGEKLLRATVYRVYRMKILNHEELRRMKYGMEAILNELGKTVILLIVFTALNRLNYFLFSLLILMTIRVFSGGLHFQTNLSCLLFSLIFFIAAVFSDIYPFFDPTGRCYAAILASTAVIGVLSPLPSANRPIRSRNRYRRLKLDAVLLTLLWSYVLLFHVEDYRAMSCGIATIVLQAAQLVAGYLPLFYKNSVEGRLGNNVK